MKLKLRVTFDLNSEFSIYILNIVLIILDPYLFLLILIHDSRAGVSKLFPCRSLGVKVLLLKSSFYAPGEKVLIEFVRIFRFSVFCFLG